MAHPNDFPETRWSLILAARLGDRARREALEAMLGAYWKPIYHYMRRKGLDADAAQDAVQELVAHLLAQDFLGRVDPERGRFRSYLRTAADHLLINLHEKRTAQKRGGGQATLSLDFDVAERELVARTESPEAAFDRDWALGVMDRALARLKAEFDGGARKGPIDIALDFFRGAEPPSYADAAARAGMPAPTFKAFLHRTRVRFRELVKSEVAGTVGTAAHADQEVADLMAALRA